MANIYDKQYKNFNAFLEYNFIPRCIQMKRKVNSVTKEIEVMPSISLKSLVKIDTEDHILHALKYLSDKEIKVEEKNPEFFIENFKYVTDLKSNVKPQKFINDDLELIQQYKATRDIKIRDEIIMKNVGIVNYIAYQFSRKTNIHIEEIESYGYEGLINALEAFDINKSDNFSSFANNCVRNIIINSIPKIYGFKMGDFYMLFDSAKAEIENYHGVKLEENFDLIYDIIELMKKRSNNPYMGNRVSIAYHEDLDENIASEEDMLELEFEMNNLYENLNMIIENLPYKEREVVKYLYGFTDGKKHTLEETGEVFNLSRERIRTICKNAIKLLKHPKNFRNIVVPYELKNSSSDEFIEPDLNYGKKL